MKEKTEVHFGGVWAAAEMPDDERFLRPVLHFFGTNYVVFLEFEKPNRLSQSIFQYVLGPHNLTLQPLDDTSEGEAPAMQMKWQFIDNEFLVLDEQGKQSLWEPATVEELVDEGYPDPVFQSLRRSFTEEGLFFLEVPLVPDPSAFR